MMNEEIYYTTEEEFLGKMIYRFNPTNYDWIKKWIELRQQYLRYKLNLMDDDELSELSDELKQALDELVEGEQEYNNRTRYVIKLDKEAP